MLFVRNPTGISHSPEEWAERDDCLAGVASLAMVLEDLAGVGGMTDAATGRTYWAENAWLPGGLAVGVRFTVADGRFADVQTRQKAQEGDERLSGLVLPGLANTHSHAFHRALRGRTTTTAATSGRGASRCMP